ncbi:MAG TPA: PKD domain-containing protein [Candidatus Deferrimicrobium sp.]|nr:PKD domain-containing protein [Candidatus Deferrimicrobium sp.]
MNRRTCLAVIGLLVAVLVCLLPGCDKLVTERIQTTIAGHPTAEFSVDVDTGCGPLTVRFRSESQGPHDSLIWVFGDGDTLGGDSADSNIVTPLHTYDSAGAYNVKLTIVNSADGGFDEEFKKRFVIVGVTVADFTAAPDSACPEVEVSFSPAGAAGVKTWKWFFGDGTQSTDSMPKHVYNTAGTYTCSLTVTGDCGQKTIAYDSLVQITNCPIVAFHVDTADGYTVSGCAPDTVGFVHTTDLGPEGFDSLRWSFGNGVTSSSQEPVAIYNEPGNYAVTLTVWSTGGSSTLTRTDYISVFDSARAVITALSDTRECYSSSFQFQVKFEADSLGTVDSFVWYFGDGTRSNNSDTTPVHAYVQAGKYTVKLEAYGPCGGPAVDSAVDYVILSNQPHSDSVGFTISPDSGDTSTLFTFSDTSMGVILYRQWLIDTLAVSDSVAVTQKFSDSGWYDVTFRVGNDCDTLTVIDSFHVIIP